MNKSHKKLVFVFSFVSTILFSSIVFGGSAFADMKSSVIQKALMQGLYRCYTTGAVTNDAGNLSSFHKFEKLIVGGGQQNYVALPTSLTDISDNNISCKGLFMGDGRSLFSETGSFDGLFKMFGKGGYAGNLTNDPEKIALLEGMGYSPSEESSTKSCVYYVYDNDDPYSNGESYTQKVCLAGGAVAVEENNDFGCGDGSSICEAPVYFNVDGNTLTIKDSLWTTEEKITYAGNWDDFKIKLNSVMSSKFSDVDNGDAFFYRFSGEKSANTQEASGDNNYVVENDDMSVAAEKAITFLYPSYTKHADIKFTDQEKLWYYGNTIGNWFFKGRGLDDYYRCGLSDNPSLYGNYVIININPSTNAKNVAGDCGLNRDLAEGGGGVYGFDRNNYFDANGTLGTLDLDGVVMQINMLVGGLSDDELDNMDGAVVDEDQSNQPSCYSGSGALGWILCPVIQMVSGVGETIWKDVEGKYLKIPAGEIFRNSSGVWDAWGAIRDIANVLFILLFLMVIFSQLTGVGIDNYGIKKILPRLIVVAVLINLSYIICELAIDLSNIVGNGLNNMLSRFAQDIAGSTNLQPAGFGYSASAWGFDLALVGGGAALFIFLNPAGALAAAAAIGIAVLGVIISIVVALLVLYIIVLIRSAGVILLTVLAPVAIVCYALPNTEKLAKKWFDLFKALLVVYPICGALVGGGQMAGAVLAKIAHNGSGATDSGMALAAMVVQVLPFFLIPTLLKNSLALMGSIGAKISSIGRNLGAKGSAKAQGAIKGSEKFKDWSQYQQEKTAGKRAQRVRDRLSGRTDLTRRQQDRLAKANATLISNDNKRRRTEIGASELGFETGMANQAVAFENEREKMYSENFTNNARSDNVAILDEALAGGDAARASAALKTVLEQGGIDEALTSLGGADWSNMNSAVMGRVLQSMGGSGVDAMKSYQKYRSTGGRASFREWASGVGATIASEAGNASIKDKTFAHHLRDNGVHAMDAYSKDEMQFVRNNAANLYNQLGSGTFGSMIGSMAINSRDAKAQTVTEGIIMNQIANGNLSGDELGLTSENIGAMREETANAIYQGYRQQIEASHPGASAADIAHDIQLSINTAFANQIAGVNADPRIKNRTSQGVKDVFGIS